MASKIKPFSTPYIRESVQGHSAGRSYHNIETHSSYQQNDNLLRSQPRATNKTAKKLSTEPKKKQAPKKQSTNLPNNKKTKSRNHGTQKAEKVPQKTEAKRKPAGNGKLPEEVQGN